MGKPSPEVSGWSKLGLQGDEFEVLVREMGASPAFLKAYGGDTSASDPVCPVRHRERALRVAAS
jgi:hypothetical protein